jgi:hypothetical protein
MTMPFPEPGHPARRELRRDQPGREGMEAELVARLTRDVSPEGGRGARCCAASTASSPPGPRWRCCCWAQGSVTAVRELVDEITARTDEDSRAGDSLVRDRADALTRLFVEHEAACARAVARWRAEAAGARRRGRAGRAAGGGPAADEATYFERVFDRVLADGA